MKIVIEISEKAYTQAKWLHTVLDDERQDVFDAITNGTPLPKNHGRLIDADAIKFCEIDEIGGEYNPYLGCSKKQIDKAPTIIEADKGGNE